MSETTPTPASVLDEQENAVLTAFDYALKRFKLECQANWRAPVPGMVGSANQAKAAIARCAVSLLYIQDQRAQT